MSKTVDLSGKFSTEKPAIVIDGKRYIVNNGIREVTAFQAAGQAGPSGMLEGLETVLGKEAYEELGVGNFSLDNIQVLTTGVMAAVLGVSYDEALARFQRAIKQSGDVV
ncbi:hypothetical protein SAMN04487969_101130 [Paenibacillus algorifonticola]|uniref:Uncharacterized protein n=1 Tax=Paenibacillus algorifonticola TaxID=684063 RepID=A0A1I1XW13_9BACL|nr:hypothetical protein [Paenibacillus algorifonticola]SFE11494.1 hypothetical protein SAMN04487969_101130 [Paenibacillus algorifonticola]